MKPLKIGFAVLFILLVSFFVVKSCVHPKRSPYGEEPGNGIPFLSRLVAPSKHIVIAPRPVAPAEETAVPAPAKSPHVAIILDDWGKNYSVLKYAVEMHRPLTIAIIPNLTYSRKIAEEAHAVTRERTIQNSRRSLGALVVRSNAIPN